MPSTDCKSASISSVSIVSTSRLGLMSPFDVHHVFIFVTADDVQNGIHVAQVAEKLVAEPFAPRCAPHQPGDIDQLKNGRNDFLRFDVAVDRRQPRIGNRHGADVRLDRAKRIVLAGDAHGRERVEQRALSDVRQSDDACFHDSFRWSVT